MLNNAYQTYKQQSIMTMTSGEMLTALYDGILKELERVKIAFGQKDYAQINQSLQKVQRILQHLKSSLDFKYEVAQGLDSLYDYFIHITVQANLHKDPTGLAEVEEMVTELRAAYREADRQARAREA